jgi:bleomycin hydrolase
MKKLLIPALFILATLQVFAQTNEPYSFKEYKRHAATPVKSQDQTGTCWAFSTASFLESEVLRLGKGEVNLSEMFVVRNIYRLKCENYVRRQGHAQFGEGGLAHDLLLAVKRFGIVPESVYPGRKDPSKPYNHSAIAKALAEKCKTFVQQGTEGKLDATWLQQIDQMLDQEFGALPNKFNDSGVAFTPIAYREFLGINPDDYVTITSFTHHPFWSSFILEIPDNWSNGAFYNMPLDDMMRAATYAIEHGYTLEWDADVSNMGFSHNNGVAIVPKTTWQEKSAAARSNAFKMWEPEQKITQEYRQQMFDKQETMDDHLMHITGVLDETHSGLFFAVKNSWGEASENKGYVNTSEAYMRLNTISYTLHKDALPQDIRRRVGLEPGEVKIEQTEKTETPQKDLKPHQIKANTGKKSQKPVAESESIRPEKSLSKPKN